MDFFEKFVDPNVKNRLTKLVQDPFVRIQYRDAIKLLQDEIKLDPSKWQYPNVVFGTDLQTEHERWLAEKKFNSCTSHTPLPLTDHSLHHSFRCLRA
jgi:asparaginyl-tRNA synthetase